ncbi:TIM barrel protein [Nanoarchaeota archaeon]
MPNSLLFGTAGVPLSCEERSTVNGIEEVNNLGLGAMELEFVRSVNISKEKAPEVKQTAEKNKIVLTCHGQYYINLYSLEKPKIHASIQRIINAARIANLCGAWSVCFHAGFYMKRDPEEVYKNIKKYLNEAIEKLKEEDNNIWVRPETTGKGTQFGTVDEILQLSHELDNVMPCVDFSHLHARSNGKYNTKEEFKEVLNKVEKVLGKKGLNNMHIHISGINYGEKGERNHLELKESDLNYKDLLKTLKEYNVRGVVISESPNIEEDAKLMKKYYEGV